MYLKQHGNRLTLLFAIRPGGEVVPVGRNVTALPSVGWELISLIQPAAEVETLVTSKIA